VSDHRVVTVIETSRLFQLVATTAARASRAAQASGAGAGARQIVRWWSARMAVQRALGIMLITAGLMHIGWRLTVRPAGWLWLVIPIWAVVIGLLLLAASIQRPREIKS
jgi:hypothetical protein